MTRADQRFGYSAKYPSLQRMGTVGEEKTKIFCGSEKSRTSRKTRCGEGGQKEVTTYR